MDPSRIRRFPFARALLVLAAAFWLVAVHAQSSSAISVRADVLLWLTSGQYSALDRYYAGVQQGYESGSISEDQLKDAFHDIDQGVPANEQYFDQWVHAFPKSYTARTARGAYYYRMAWGNRGDDYIEQTSQQQMLAMAHYVALSRLDLEASLRMAAKPYISTLYLLNAAMMDGSADERREWLDLGNRFAPQNVLLRTRYMIGLTPKWGGSYRQMRVFLEECRRQHLPEAQLTRLDIIVHTEFARAYRKAANTALAFEQWDTVLRLSQSVGDAPTDEALIGYTRAAWDLHRRSDADTGLQKLAGMPIEKDWILSQMAWIYVAENRMVDGWKFIKEAASFNDGWAQYGVAKTTYFGCADLHLPADPEAARAWMKRSAQNGFAQAETFLKFDAWGHVFGWLYLRVT